MKKEKRESRRANAGGSAYAPTVEKVELVPSDQVVLERGVARDGD